MIRMGRFLVPSDEISVRALSQSRVCAGSKPCRRAAVAAATTRDDGQHTASAGGGAKVASDALPRLAKPHVCRIRSSSDSSQQQQAPSAAAGRQADRHRGLGEGHHQGNQGCVQHDSRSRLPASPLEASRAEGAGGVLSVSVATRLK